MKVVIRVGEPYNLDLTIKPSFLSSLYRKVDGWWIKKIGFLGGFLRIRQESSFLIVKCNSDLNYKMFVDEVKLESGLWHHPFERNLDFFLKKLEI